MKTNGFDRVGQRVMAGMILLWSCAQANAVILASEDFDFTGALTDNGWVAHSGAGNKVILSDGTAATLQQGLGSGEDVNLAFAQQSATAKTYASFDVTVLNTLSIGNGDLDADGLYFAHFKDAATNFPSRVFVTNPTSSGDFSFGIEANDATVDKTWATDFSFDTTHKIVMAYNASTGFAELWLDPTAESSTKLTTTNFSAGILVESFALRQSSDYTGDIRVDNIAVGTDFDSVFFVWDGSTGDWNDDARWLGGVEPGINDDVTISSGTVNVTLAGEFARIINHIGGLLVVDAGNLQTSADITHGFFLDSDMNIVNSGAVTTGSFRIGQSADSDVDVSGASSQLTMTRRFIIGRGGIGSLDVLDGASVFYNDTTDFRAVEIADDTGGGGSQLTVSGTGSTLNTNGLRMNVGRLATGHALVEAGGVVQTGLVQVAADAGSDGSTLTVTGSVSQWLITDTVTDGHLTIGDAGQASVIIEDGGLVSASDSLFIGLNAAGANSTLTVQDAGSQLILSGSATIGGGTNPIGAPASMSILNGGYVETGSGAGSSNISLMSGSNGSIVTVSGTGSIWELNGERLNVGGVDAGHLLISAGGVANTGAGVISDNPGSSGSSVTVTGTGSRWNITDNQFLVVGDLDQGHLTVDDGGIVDVSANVLIGQGGGTGSTATITGAGSRLDVATRLTVGRNTLSTLLIEQGGTVSTGVDPFGLIISDLSTSGGSSVTVRDAGSVLTTNGEAVLLGDEAPGSLLVEGGGAVNSGSAIIGNVPGSAGSNVTVRDSGSQWNVTGDLTVGNASTSSIDVLDQGHLDVSGTLRVHIGSATINMGATAEVGTLNVIPQSSAVNADLVIDNGSMLDVLGDVRLDSINTTRDGAMFVRNNSVVNVGGIVTVGTGGLTGLQGLLIVESGAAMTIDGLLLIDDGRVQLSEAGATLSAGSISRNTIEEVFNWSAGTLELTGTGLTLSESASAVLNNGNGQGQTPDDPGIAGNQADRLILTDDPVTGRNLHVSAVTSIDGDKGLTLNGGTFRTGSVSLIDGTLTTTKPLIFNSGTLELTNSDMTVGNSGILRENNTYLFANDTLIVSGRTLVDPGASLQLVGGSFTSGGLALMGNATLRHTGHSAFSSGPVTAATASRILIATGDLTLGSGSAVNGFYSNGDVTIAGGSTLTLEDANDAVFDSAAFVTLGDASAGTLAAANGLTLDFGGNVTGFGTIDTPDDPFKPFTNNGNITGDSGGNPITLTGYVKGVGTMDNVVITGTDAPGFSPATVYRGSVTYAGNLEVEVGGTSAGDFDRIIHSGNATLGGVLDVLLINGFSPSAGDSFDILDWATVSGDFATLNLPVLGGGLDWDSSSLTIDGTLSVVSAALQGDLNNDGFVGIADLNIVLGAWNQSVPPADPAADPSGDNFVGIADLNEVLGNWNSGTPPVNNANIPEPSTLLMLTTALLATQRLNGHLP